MAINLGPYTFDTQSGSDADQFLYTGPVATDAIMPQSPNTTRRRCHDTKRPLRLLPFALVWVGG